MDFAKFLFIALILDFVAFSIGLSTSEQMGGGAGSFAAAGQALASLMGNNGQINTTTINKMAPTTSNQTGYSIQTQSTFFGFFDLASKFAGAITNVVKVIWGLLAAPAKLAGQILYDISNSNTGFGPMAAQTNTGLDLIVNGFAAIWVLGEVIGLYQFIRGRF